MFWPDERTAVLHQPKAAAAAATETRQKNQFAQLALFSHFPRALLHRLRDGPEWRRMCAHNEVGSAAASGLL